LAFMDENPSHVRAGSGLVAGDSDHIELRLFSGLLCCSI